MKKTRSQRASTLALVGASAIVIALIILFALLYLHTGVQNDKQRSAIDSAALAAATDIGNMVYNSPECGFVSLTGAPPTSSGTQELAGGTTSGDNYIDQVHSINELLATARLDYIIASTMPVKAGGNNTNVAAQDKFMQQLALRDEQNALNARDELMQIIAYSIAGTGQSGYDIAGNAICAYDDAYGMYTSNPASASSNPPTITIELGCLQGGVVTPIKVPTDPGNLCSPSPASGATSNDNFYMSDVAQTYTPSGSGSGAGTFTCMLSSVGSQTTIVDKGKFCPVTMTVSANHNTKYVAANLSPSTEPQTTINTANASSNTVDLLVPAAVRVTAVQTFNVQGKQFQNTFVSCAVPGGNFKTASYAELTVSFPDGPVPEITCLADTYGANWQTTGQTRSTTTVTSNMTQNVDTYTGAGNGLMTFTGNDYCGAAYASSGSHSTNFAIWGDPLPFASATNPTCAELSKTCIHDWLRQEGSQADIDTFLNAQTATFVVPSGWGAFFKGDNVTPKNTVQWKTYGPTTSQSTANPMTIGSVPKGFMAIYSFYPELPPYSPTPSAATNTTIGQVNQFTEYTQPAPYMAVSENQLFAQGWDLIQDNTNPNPKPPNPPFPNTGSYLASWNDPQTPIPTLWVPTNGSPAPQNNIQFTGMENVDVYFRDETIQPGNGNTSQPHIQSATIKNPATYTATANGGQHAGQPIYPIAQPISTTLGGNLNPPPTICCSGTSPDCSTAGTGGTPICIGGGCVCQALMGGVCTGPGGTCGPTLPCTCPQTTSTLTGNEGAPPLLNSASNGDWDQEPTWNSLYPGAGPFELYGTTATATQRPTYQNSCIAADIRFRRRVECGIGKYFRVGSTGYIGLMY